MFAPGKALKPSLLFVAKAGAYPITFQMFHFRLGSWPSPKQYTRLERLARVKQSILYKKLVTYGHKSVYNIGPSGQYYKTFLGIIDAL